jgi:hypothetical protein
MKITDRFVLKVKRQNKALYAKIYPRKGNTPLAGRSFVCGAENSLILDWAQNIVNAIQ